MSTGDSTAVRHARLTLLEFEPGKPLSTEEAWRYQRAMETVAKAEADDANRQTMLQRMYGVAPTPAPRSATPRSTTPLQGTPAAKLAHLRRLFGDERSNPGLVATLPPPMRHSLVAAKRAAGERLTEPEARSLERSSMEIGMLGGRIAEKRGVAR